MHQGSLASYDQAEVLVAGLETREVDRMSTEYQLVGIKALLTVGSGCSKVGFKYLCFSISQFCFPPVTSLSGRLSHEEQDGDP